MQRKKALTDETAAITKRLDAGEPLATIAADKMLTVKTGGPVTRLDQPSGDLSADVLTKAFDTDKGKSAVADGADPFTSVVFTVTDAVDPPYDPTDSNMVAIKNQLNSQLATDLLSTYAARLQSETDVHLNQAAIAAALGITPTQ